jgi:hypothetical protein
VFVRHYLKWRESKLPTVSAVVTSPLLLKDGTFLATPGLDRERGIVFRLQPELLSILPKPEDCTPTAVAHAMSFLTDEWLCDVATDYKGKCIIIAAALTIIERVVLEQRPAFFITAGQRGGGKTTVIQMLFLAATGYPAAAAAWSNSDEERRKTLLSYLSEGVPAVLWDNIPRGLTISCPSIEKSLTSMTYSDRILGETATRTVPSTTINFFTGNNITPRGDTASRSLQARLNVDRPDPENREFKHGDPVAWTDAHRGNILAALYTILLGNPRIRDPNPTAAVTRFKDWWHLVGSAVEYAAEQHAAHVAALVMDGNTGCPACKVEFKVLFLDGEKNDEQASSLAAVLHSLKVKWKDKSFKASEVATHLGLATAESIELKSALEQATGRLLPIVTATTVSWRLTSIADAPVLIEKQMYVLTAAKDGAGKRGADFEVKVTKYG